MGVRVRKLARELECTPGQVLGLLEALGYQRYKSSDDMISDTVAARVRQSARQEGRLPGPSAVDRPAPRGRTSPAPASDLMAQLVPGVVRERSSDRHQPHRAPPKEPKAPVAAPTPPAVGEDRAALERALAEGEDLRRQLESARAEAVTLREDLEAHQRAAEAGQSLLDLLEERGLSGVDEAERAIAALAGSHVLGRLLRTLKPADPEGLRRVLADHLILVGGPVPEGLELPTVTVAEDRADIPSADRLARLTGRLGEQLLLSGLKKVLLVGVVPRWQALVRAGVDRRIDLTFRPGGSRDAARAAEEARGVDAVVLWNTPAGEDAVAAYGAARAHLLQIQAPDFGSFLDRVVAALAME